jgi:hypothetical protein
MLAFRLRPRNAAFRGILTSHRRWMAIVSDVDVPKSKKVWDSVEKAVSDVKSGDVVLSGGRLALGILICVSGYTDHCG